MVYRAAPVTQRDGSPLASSNCLMAAAAVGLDYHSLGAKTSTGAKMRSYSGDTSGGTNTDEIERAWHTGYDEDPITRDGRPWSDVLEDLRAGRLVMLQVWHATVGGPCLSGSGSYGHGLAVAPEQHSDGRWLVADPWCSPPKWSWVSEAKLKAGAIEWADRCSREAGGRPLRDLEPELLRAVVRLLFARYTPDHPAVNDPAPEVGGAGGVLFASTRAYGGDMAVNVSANDPVSSGRVADVSQDADIYADGNLADKLTDLSGDRTVTLLGTVVGGHPDARAIITNMAGALYDDGVSRPSIVYVHADRLHNIRDAPAGPPSDDVIAALVERDSEWRAWLEIAPSGVTALVAEAPALVAWADDAPDVADPPGE